jgi:hypothetical protein
MTSLTFLISVTNTLSTLHSSFVGQQHSNYKNGCKNGVF